MNWKHSIKIKHFFTDDDSPEAVSNCMKSVAAVLESNTFAINSPSLASTIAKMKRCRSQRHAIVLLNRLYDWADQNSVWLE